MPTIRPSATAMSMVDSSVENTLTKVAFFSTRSAGSRPAAAAMIRCFFSSFEYEIREASRCVKLGRTGSDRYTPQDSLALTRLMYDTRMSWGMKFAGEV